MTIIVVTRHPVPHKIDLESPDIIHIDDENSTWPAAHILRAEFLAFKEAGIKDGDIVYVTVAHGDGSFKPGNVRNDPRRVRYDKLKDGTEFVSLFRAK